MSVIKSIPYHFDDSSFKQSEFGKDGKALKEFFDDLCREIYRINLTMYFNETDTKDMSNENKGYFPLTWGERSSFSSIAAALHKITPYVMSEYGITIEKDEKRRMVDFWCEPKEIRKEMWIECKYLGFNVGNKNLKFDQATKDCITKAYEQVADLYTCDKEYKESTYKLILLNTCAYAAYKNINNLADFDSSLKAFKEQLESIKAGGLQRKSKGFLYASLDFTQRLKKADIHHKNYEKEGSYYGIAPSPYYILAGIFLA